jgi:DNA-binding transcriptional LysR family regulator
MTDFIINDALTFVTVIDTGSFTTAAKKLSISPSVLSKRLKRLEEFLQIQLTQRSTRKIILTDSGNVFYEHWKRIREAIDEANTNIIKHQELPYGILRINSPTSFGEIHMIPAVNDFIKLYPEMQVELILGSRYAEFIYHGLDLAIFIKELPNSMALKAHKITTRTTGIYGSARYFQQYGIPQTPLELSQHNCLLFKPEITINSIAKDHEWLFFDKKPIAVAVKGNFQSNNNRALVKLAIAGIGLVRVSNFMVTEAIKNGSLQQVLQSYSEIATDIHVAYPAQRFTPYKVKLFINFLSKRFHSQGYWEKIRA